MLSFHLGHTAVMLDNRLSFSGGAEVGGDSKTDTTELLQRSVCTHACVYTHTHTYICTIVHLQQHTSFMRTKTTVVVLCYIFLGTQKPNLHQPRKHHCLHIYIYT